MTPSPSRKHSGSRTRTPSPPESANEVSALLPPNSRPRTPNSHHTFAQTHNRKVSVGQRSIAGSVRNYGAVNGRSPAEQAPRVSKVGQRRILTTLPLQLVFFTLVVLTFASVVLTLILFINTATDLSVVFLPYRGSGFAEFWLSAVGSWIALGGVLFFSHPSSLYFWTTLLITILQFPILLVTLLNGHLKRAHYPLMIIPFFLTLAILLITLLSNYLVRRARYRESQRISRMLTEAAARERSGDEAGARAAVGLQGSVWGRIVHFLGGVIGFVAGLAALVLVTLLLVDFSISAYDSTIDLPAPSSRLVNVKSSPWPIKIHLSCSEAPNSTFVNQLSYPLRRATFPRISLPTIIYEPSSGVPGSLALLNTPLPPANEGTENPGEWIFDLQASGKVGRVCVWDRPGYGFSEILTGADLGSVSDLLYGALEEVGEVDKAREKGFMLVGEGYGGLLTRVFASRHPELIHSILHLDAQSAQTYFSENPHGLSLPSLVIRRVTGRLLPSLLTPLSLTRLPSVLLRRSSSLSRLLASTMGGTERLNENLQKARLQETFGSHSHTSSSFRVLLESGLKYPANKPAIVISSQEHMDGDADWAEGQRGLAEEVTGEEGLVDWVKVPGVGHEVCKGDGKGVCVDAVKRLLREGGK